MSAFPPGQHVEPHEELISMAKNTYELSIKPYVRPDNHKRAWQCLLMALSCFVTDESIFLADEFACLVGIEPEEMCVLSDHALHQLGDEVNEYVDGRNEDDVKGYALKIRDTPILQERMDSLEGDLWTDEVQEADPLPLPPAPHVPPAVLMPVHTVVFYPVPVPVVPMPMLVPAAPPVAFMTAHMGPPPSTALGGWQPVLGHPAHQG